MFFNNNNKATITIKIFVNSTFSFFQDCFIFLIVICVSALSFAEKELFKYRNNHKDVRCHFCSFKMCHFFTNYVYKLASLNLKKPESLKVIIHM